MKVFLDTSVLLAAAGSENGASRHIFNISAKYRFKLISSPYCVAETNHNIPKLGESAGRNWDVLIYPAIQLAEDRITLDRPLIFPAAKDKPVMITALAARCEWLLTLDRQDFGDYFVSGVYGMRVGTPGNFLQSVIFKNK